MCVRQAACHISTACYITLGGGNALYPVPSGCVLFCLTRPLLQSYSTSGCVNVVLYRAVELMHYLTR